MSHTTLHAAVKWNHVTSPVVSSSVACYDRAEPEGFYV